MASQTFTTRQVCQIVTGEDGDMDYMFPGSDDDLDMEDAEDRDDPEGQIDSESETGAEMKQAYDTLLDAEDSPPSSQSRMNSDNSESDYRTG